MIAVKTECKVFQEVLVNELINYNTKLFLKYTAAAAAASKGHLKFFSVHLCVCVCGGYSLYELLAMKLQTVQTAAEEQEGVTSEEEKHLLNRNERND